jgi:hypothetical protein
LLLLLLLLLRVSFLQLFDAPQLVRHALNNVCNLDGSYIMTSHDLDAARALMEAHRNVRRVYSPQVRGGGGAGWFGGGIVASWVLETDKVYPVAMVCGKGEG